MIVTDTDMPELGGFEMMRCIRAINPRARAIYMSGAPEHYRRTLVSETQNFSAMVLRKPFGEIELLKLIQPIAGPGSPDDERFVLEESSLTLGQRNGKTVRSQSAGRSCTIVAEHEGFSLH